MSVSSKLSAKSAVAGNEQESNGNSALDWEIFDILCKDELGLTVSLVYHIPEFSVETTRSSFMMGDKIIRKVCVETGA